MIPANQLEIFRDAILISLKAARTTGRNLSNLRLELHIAGFRNVQDGDITDELAYFIDAGFIALVPKSHSVGNRIWRITKDGIDDLERRGF